MKLLKINPLNAIFLLGNLALVTIAYTTYNEALEKEDAFAECIEEVTNKCSGVISYAIALEGENARLNSKVGKCNENR